MSDSPLLLLFDGHSLAFRAYYAFSLSKSGALRTSEGIPTSVSFGFINSLLQIIDAEGPDYVGIAFDLAEPTFRHEADSNYKADREETPEDFIIDLVNLQQLLTALNFSLITASGYEADDVLGTLAYQGVKEGYRVKIVSGDRDLFQLVDSEAKISVLYLDRTMIKTASYLEFHFQQVVEKMGVKPNQVVDYKALCGDKSDNIPGVKGVGDKTAVKLLQSYENLEEIYAHLDEIKGSLKTKLATGKEAAFHSQKLAQIITDIDLNLPLSSLQLTGFNWQDVNPILAKLELKSIAAKLQKLEEKLGNQETTKQLELWQEKTIIPQIIDTETKLKELVEILSKNKNAVAWDTETTDLEPKDAELVGIGCCWGEEKNAIAYIPINHTQGKQLSKSQVLSKLAPILESSDYPKVLQNAKFDRSVFWQHGIKLAGVTFDTMLASYLINPEKNHNLKDLANRYLENITSKSYQELGIPKGETIASLDIPTVAEYCGLDAYATFCVYNKIKAELAKLPQLNNLLLTVEQPLEPILAEMEYQGVLLDVEYLEQLSQQIEQELHNIREKAYNAVGEEFNLDSPKQLAVLLFDQLELDKRKSRKTKTGYSTDHATLEKLQGDHPVIDYILEYRTLAKLKSTYIDALPQLVRKDTQRVHTNYNQTNTTTGRLSSSNPNLQNIPIRTEFSRQIRQAFIPSPDWILVAADYSQIELRILAHLSQEPVLVKAYQNNQDVHTVTAQLLFDKQEITSEERRLGKIINFGVIYGMGAQRFAREAGVSADEGKQFITKYRQRYPQIFAYLETMKQQAIAQGFVTTICGRRRYFEFTSESLRELRGAKIEEVNLNQLEINHNDAQLLRAAANAPIQGSSADIIKIAMVNLSQVLDKYQARLLLQVHDELVLEMPPAEWEELRPQIKSTMENVIDLSIPLVVDIHSGKNWMEAK